MTVNPVDLSYPDGAVEALMAENDKLISERSALLQCEEALREWERLSLVIESAVRECAARDNRSSDHHRRIVAMIHTARAALTLLDEARHGK